MSAEDVARPLTVAKRARRAAQTRCGNGLPGGATGGASGLNGKDIRKGAKVGRSFTVRFFTRDGQRVTKKMTLRAERKGDDAGRPLSR